MNHVKFFLKMIIFSCILTFLFLVILAFCDYKMHLEDATLSGAILSIYFISNFFAGFITGRKKKEKKFLWGGLNGLLYFFLLSILTFCMTHGFYSSPKEALLAFFACFMGAVLGGMIS